MRSKMKSYKVLDTAAVLLVVSFLTYAGVIFLKPDAVVSDTETSFPAPQPAAVVENRTDLTESPTAAFTQPVQGDDFEFLPPRDPESEFYISSSHAHLIDEVKQSLPALTAAGRDSSGSSAAASGIASAGSSASSVSSSSGGSSSSASLPSSPISGRGAGSFPGQSIVEELRKLRPLPKVHYSWGLKSEFISNRENEFMYELARLTHSLSIAGEWVTESQMDNCVYTCARINKTNPEIPCSIGINYSPWHRKFKPELGLGKSIPKKYNHTIFSDPTYSAEIEQFVLKMTAVKRWVNESNAKYGTDVKIGAILLDCERFYRRPKDPHWNDGMGKAQNAIHAEAVKLFPDARIEWYNRGRFQGTDENRPMLSNYLVDNLVMTGMSCSLYSPPYRTRMQKLFRATCDLADTHTIDGKTPWSGLDVTPWVALNYGMDWEIYKSGERDLKVCHRNYGPWDYPYSFSREMGADINSTDSPYDRAKVAVFFPAPFDSNFPNWGRHFIEYCKGAAHTGSQ